MRLPLFQVDAFTDQVFGGNPAAIVLLEDELPSALLQSIAAENNLSETAYLVELEEARYHLRWFTPVLEVDLCGHATLASAFVLFHLGKVRGEEIRFETRSGMLKVRKDGDWLCLDFPARPPHPVEIPDALVSALRSRPEEVLRSERDWMAVFSDEQCIRELDPNFSLLAELDCFAVIVSAPATEVDFVSRFFAPKAGIPEDPVTGSAHCVLTPYWSARLGKRVLDARQVSRRGGILICEDRGERVLIRGKAVEYLRGEITVK